MVAGDERPAGLRSSKATVPAVTASLKVAVGLIAVDTPAAPAAGARALTVGLVVSAASVVNVHADRVDQVAGGVAHPA